MQRFSNLSLSELALVKATHKVKIFDSPYEVIFKSTANTAKDIFQAPIALISFINLDSKWFKPSVGLDGMDEMPIELAFCWQTVNTEGVFCVADASQDKRFKDNPLLKANLTLNFLLVLLLHYLWAKK